MLIQISLQDGVPIYRQIVNQIKYLIASGQLACEEELPPIRTLAKQLAITPNTVVKAYGELEAEGLIYKKQGAGTFIASRSSPLARKEQRRIILERIDALLAEASHLNFTFDQILELLRQRHAAMQRALAKAEQDAGGKADVRKSG